MKWRGGAAQVTFLRQAGCHPSGGRIHIPDRENGPNQRNAVPCVQHVRNALNEVHAHYLLDGCGVPGRVKEGELRIRAEAQIDFSALTSNRHLKRVKGRNRKNKRFFLEKTFYFFCFVILFFLFRTFYFFCFGPFIFLIRHFHLLVHF